MQLNACLSLVLIAICDSPNRLGSSSGPALRMMARRPGRRVVRCVPQSPQNSRVTAFSKIVALEPARLALGVAETLGRHQHEHVRRAAGEILARTAMALRPQHRLSRRFVANPPAIASAFQFHALLLRSLGAGARRARRRSVIVCLKAILRERNANSRMSERLLGEVSQFNVMGRHGRRFFGE